MNMVAHEVTGSRMLPATDSIAIYLEGYLSTDKGEVKKQSLTLALDARAARAIVETIERLHQPQPAWQ